MFKLVLEKTEEPEIKLPTSAGSWKIQTTGKRTWPEKGTGVAAETAALPDSRPHHVPHSLPGSPAATHLRRAEQQQEEAEGLKAQHEGALPPPCIVRKDPRVPHTARRGA